MDTATLLNQIANGAVIALIPNPRPPEHVPKPAEPARRWYSVREVAQMLGFSLSKTKMLIAAGEIRSVKDGKLRRVLPEWVDEYVARRVKQAS